MMPVRRRDWLTAVSAFALTAGLSACGSDAGSNAAAPPGAIPSGPIVLAGTASLSGPLAAYGAPQAANYQAAADYINEKLDGIDGHPIELRIENDQSDPATGVAHAQQFISDGVAAIVYPSLSPIADQLYSIYQRAGVVVTTAEPTPATFDDLEKYPLVFSHFPDFDHLYSSAPTFLTDSGIKTVGILRDTLETLEPVAKRLEDQLEDAGVEVTAVETVPYGATEFTTALRKLRDSGAQSLVALNMTGLAQVYDALRGIGWEPQTINAQGTAWFDGLDAVGDLADRTYAECFYGVGVGEELDPVLAEVLDYFAKKTGASFPAQISGALPALNALLTYKFAVEQADTLEASKVVEAIESFDAKEYLTPENVLSFSPIEHVGSQQSTTCSLLPLSESGTPYVATSTTERQPLS